MGFVNITKIKMALILSSAIFVAACGSSKQQAMLDTIGSPQTRPATFEALQGDFRTAERENVHLFAPRQYGDAKKSFEQAQSLRAEGQSEDKFTGKLKDARKDLDTAVAFSKRHRASLTPLIEARETSLVSGAAETTNRDLASLEKEYLSLVRDLDGRKRTQDRAMKRIPVLTQKYRDLTVKTLQAKHLGAANINLGTAKREGAEELVPMTLRETENKIKVAHDYIAENSTPASERRVTQLGKEATEASERLVNLTRQTKASSRLSPEERSLQTEGRSRSATAESERMRESSEAESARLRQRSEQLEDKLSGTQRQVSDLESRQQDYARLERRGQERSQRDQQFESARGLFSEEEASVSRQGDNLIISLKKINFAVNESEIPSHSFGLLGKVQKAIGGFNEPSIVIEGHSDSTGNSELNMALSKRRAEAVKEYFLSNNVLSPERVVAMGYGAEKPLASNQSSAGRAINRRIDIIIKD